MASVCSRPLLASPSNPELKQRFQCRYLSSSISAYRLSALRVRSRDLRCRSTSTEKEKEKVNVDVVDEGPGRVGEGGGNFDGGDGGDGDGASFNWISNAPVFILWAGLAAYAFSSFSPNQTPYRDQLFLEKLLFLRGDEGFSLNPLLVTVWYSMGLLPLIYAMLLIPTGRSEKGGVPVWPFSLASFFVGVFALLPYFGLWNPPPPRVTKEELTKWPLIALESKVLSAVVAVAAVGLVAKALLCSGEAWSLYLGFFRESRFIHVMSIDFALLNLLAIFWVSNDMSVRRCNASWLTAVSFVPLVGPALYLLVRPSLPPEMIED